MKFTVYQESRIGGRAQNQDRVAWRHTRESVLLVVADGMGGHADGELAAQVAVDSICAAFDEGATPGVPHPFLFLTRAMQRAHHAIGAAAQARSLPESPRTTCVICLIQDGAALWAHAGDSRLYLLREGRVIERTRDHSRVQFLIDAGSLSEAAARTHPERNIVLSCLGGAHAPQISHSRKTSLRGGDVLVLCTDGAWAPLAQEDMVQGLGGGNLMASVPAFLDRVETAAGRGADNTTLIALQWESPAAADADIAELDEFERRQLVGATLSDEDLSRAVLELRTLRPFQPSP